jgi:hypothetical protein
MTEAQAKVIIAKLAVIEQCLMFLASAVVGALIVSVFW